MGSAKFENQEKNMLCRSFLRAPFFCKQFNVCIATSLISCSVSKQTWIIHLRGKCVCWRLSGLSLQVSRLYHETEMPTSPLTNRMSLPAQWIPSTRPRTAKQESAHTERTRWWTMQWFPLTFYAAVQPTGGIFTVDSTSVPVFCTVDLLQIAGLKTNWMLLLW